MLFHLVSDNMDAEDSPPIRAPSPPLSLLLSLSIFESTPQFWTISASLPSLLGSLDLGFLYTLAFTNFIISNLLVNPSYLLRLQKFYDRYYSRSVQGGKLHLIIDIEE